MKSKIIIIPSIVLASIILIFFIATVVVTKGDIVLYGLKTRDGNYSVLMEDDNSFTTNDIDRAQKRIPFTIVLPTYLPTDFEPKYPVNILGRFSNEDNEVDVSIRYCGYEGETRVYDIFIDEYNYISVMMPNEDLNPVYHDIAGIRVLQQTAQSFSSSGITEGLGFDWNQNAMTYSVDVYNISEEEGIKIVESMITQMK